jgi:hypothetical protein
MKRRIMTAGPATDGFLCIFLLLLAGAAHAEQPSTTPSSERPTEVHSAPLSSGAPEAPPGLPGSGKPVYPRIGAKWLNPTPQELKSAPHAMPFAPHRATTASRTLTMEMFDNATVCATCHQQIHKQWSESVMSRSWDDPIYRALLKRASIATKGAVDNFCTGCHTPTGLTTGHINSEINRESLQSAIDEHRVLPGVDCESCHNISDHTGLDNGAYVLTPRNNAEALPQKYGPRKDAVSPYHKTVYSELHTKSEFCAVCHNVTHPFSFTPIERTFDEWQESPFNANNKNCQSCHMPKYKGKAAVLPAATEAAAFDDAPPPVQPKEREDVAAHYFAGGNTTLLEHFGLKESAQRSREMLARAAKIEITPASDVRAGKMAKWRVKVSNEGAGHKLPTGFPEGREVWVDFQVKDANGNEIFRLGRVKDGKTEEGTKNFKVHLGDSAGHEVDLEVWSVTRILSDNRILPGGYSMVEYDVPVPESVQGPLTAEAVLRYWPFPQKIVDTLLGPGALKVEIVEMAKATQRVNVEPRKQLALATDEAGQKPGVPGPGAETPDSGQPGLAPDRIRPAGP